MNWTGVYVSHVRVISEISSAKHQKNESFLKSKSSMADISLLLVLLRYSLRSHQETISGVMCRLALFLIPLTLIRLGFFDIFRLGVGASTPPPYIFIVSVPITMKFCTGIDHQNVSSNKKKDLHKTNDVIILRQLCRLSKNTQNRKHEKFN